MQVRKLVAGEVTFTVEVEAEDMPIRGNALASGDDAVDPAYENGINARLDQGDVWAWCTVWVTASWGDFTGRANLGCCSYEGEGDFRTGGGYFEGMCADALEELNKEIAATVKGLEGLLVQS
jgi:hypothetical protein